MATTMQQTIDINSIVANPQTIVPKAKASMVRNLLAQYAQLGEEEQKIQESRAAVREILVNLFEEGTSELVLDNKKMATLSKETRTLLNTELVKKNFPFEKFSDFYNQSTVTVLRLTRQARSIS